MQYFTIPSVPMIVLFKSQWITTLPHTINHNYAISEYSASSNISNLNQSNASLIIRFPPPQSSVLIYFFNYYFIVVVKLVMSYRRRTIMGDSKHEIITKFSVYTVRYLCDDLNILICKNHVECYSITYSYNFSFS